MKRTIAPYVLVWVLVVSIFVAQGVALAKGPPATNGHFTFTSTTGSAFKINDTSVVVSFPPASISITGSYKAVGKDTNMVKLRVESGSISGSLFANGMAHDIISGNGVYNPRTGKIVITALVQVQPGERGRNLVLYGTVSSAYGNYYYSQLGGDVTFIEPQSKLSGAYFLACDGTLTLG